MTLSSGRDKDRRLGWVIALIACLLAVILIVWAVLNSVNGRGLTGGSAVEDSNSSTPTVSAWDETTTPTPPPSGGTMIACPLARNNTNTRQTSDRLTAGSTSVAKVPGWTTQSMGLPWIYDLHTQITQVYIGWMSNVGVGSLANSDGFVDIRTSAFQNLDCFKTSGYYQGYTGDATLLDQAVTIDGHSAWRIRAEVYVNMDTLPQVKGDVVDILVIDLGTQSDHLGVFVSSYTIDDNRRGKLVDDCIASLRVS